MSMREQLLKAGLVTKKKAAAAEAEQRKKQHEVRTRATIDVAEDEEIRRRLEEEARLKRERDQTLNREREMEKAQREASLRAKQKLESNALDTSRGRVRYAFVEAGRWVRHLNVTDDQQCGLAAGGLAIARPDADDERYLVVMRELAEEVRAIAPEKIVFLAEVVQDGDGTGEAASAEGDETP